MTSILDGTSNTLLLGEKGFTTRTFQNLSSCNDDQGYVDGWDNDMIVFSQGAKGQTIPLGFAAIAPTSPPTVGLSYTPTLYDPTGAAPCGGFFGTVHSSGMLSVFCDGTVRSISLSVTPAAFFSMCCINDGISFDLPDS